MRFTVVRVSESTTPPYYRGAVRLPGQDLAWHVEVGTLAELVEWQRRERHSLVLSTEDGGPRIMIYDGYVE